MPGTLSPLPQTGRGCGRQRQGLRLFSGPSACSCKIPPSRAPAPTTRLDPVNGRGRSPLLGPSQLGNGGHDSPDGLRQPEPLLGTDLRAFLALGCHTGYFSLVRLAYGWGRADLIARLQSCPDPTDLEEARLLHHLTNEFDLHPWPNVDQRLTELAPQAAERSPRRRPSSHDRSLDTEAILS